MQINKRMQINREKKYAVQAFTCVQDASNQKEFSKVMNRTRGKKYWRRAALNLSSSRH